MVKYYEILKVSCDTFFFQCIAACYNVQLYYSAFILNKIKHANISNDDKPLNIIKNVIMEFCKLAGMPLNTFIDFLLIKSEEIF
jgi:hypothetical protein